MRRTALFLALFGMVLLSIAPVGATSSVYEVEFGLVSHTSGGGMFDITGDVTGNETGAVGTVVYDHRNQPTYPWSAILQVDVECMLVVPSTNTNLATDYNVLVAGPLTVVEDSDGLYDGWDWAGFVYAPDENGYGSPGARPINAQLFNGTPSCVLEEFFHSTTPAGQWTGGGYFDSGAFINVEVDPDTTAPTVTIVAPVEGASFARGSSVLAAFSCADETGGSGLASCVGTVASGAAFDTATLGAKNFTVTGTDNAGNPTVVTHSYTVTDTTAPTVTIVAPVEGASFARGSSVLAAFSCADETGGSGLASCVGTVASGAAFDTATLGAKNFTVTGTDNAGNPTVVTHSYTVTDTTAPTVTIVAPVEGASFARGSLVLAAFSCADETGGSGLASCVGTVASGAAFDTATLGAKNFTVTGIDNAGNPTVVTHNYTVLPMPDTVGVVNTDNAQWYLANSSGAITNFEYGNAGDLPVSGDWDGNASSTPGLYRPGESGGNPDGLPGGFFYGRNFNSTGLANDACFGGNPSDIPVRGDWDGDGDDTLGIMRLVNNQPTFFLFNNSCVGGAPQSNPFQNALGTAQISFEFGDAGDTPVVGDWDGDGDDEIGLYRRSNGFFYNRETPSTGAAHNACFAGDPSDYPMGGDWDGDGDGNFGIFRPADQKFFLFTTSCVGLAPPSNPFANAMGAAQIEVPVPVTTDTTYLASLVASDKLRPVAGAFGLG